MSSSRGRSTFTTPPTPGRHHQRHTGTPHTQASYQAPGQLAKPTQVLLSWSGWRFRRGDLATSVLLQVPGQFHQLTGSLLLGWPPAGRQVARWLTEEAARIHATTAAPRLTPEQYLVTNQFSRVGWSSDPPTWWVGSYALGEFSFGSSCHQAWVSGWAAWRSLSECYVRYHSHPPG